MFTKLFLGSQPISRITTLLLAFDLVVLQFVLSVTNMVRSLFRVSALDGASVSLVVVVLFD